MFNFFKKKPQGSVAVFKIEGMHCTSCAINIDGALEDLPGVFSATTSYAKSTVQVEYDPQQMTTATLRDTIVTAGYVVRE